VSWYGRGRFRIAAADGWSIDVLELTPATPRALLIAGHAMMVDGRTLFAPGRPSIGDTFARAGFVVWVPDLRGHGHSGPTPRAGGDWSYAELGSDLVHLIHVAAGTGLPVVLLGHSLSGHVALAQLCMQPQLPVCALVLFGTNVWMRRLEPSLGRWVRKRLLMECIHAAASLCGYVPAVAARFGTADEARTYWRDLMAFVRHGAWDFDLSKIECDILSISSDRDRWYAAPSECEALVGTAASCWRAGAAVSHMGLVTSGRMVPVWRRAAQWALARC
jgi:alpha-beta hydrolase superfamily lysophospholipase